MLIRCILFLLICVMCYLIVDILFKNYNITDNQDYIKFCLKKLLIIILLKSL